VTVLGACVATPHHIASAAGGYVLEAGGNAVDAAVGANLVLGVVAPYLCGYGGDLFAIVADGRELHGYLGSGRASVLASRDAVAAACGGVMPTSGPLTVTVPGAVQGWFDLLARFGTMSFDELARPAIRIARDGFALSERGDHTIAGSALAFADSAEWMAVFGRTGGGGLLRQPTLAACIERLSWEGPGALYGGEIGGDIADHVTAQGGFLTLDDLAAHTGEWVAPLRARYRDVDVAELPPPTQGAAALEALRILDGLGPLPQEWSARAHLQIEATKLALADRAHLTDPAAMPMSARTLFDESWVAPRRASIEPDVASRPLPGIPMPGGTAYLCAADADGLMVSLIQSNYMGFGSGVHVPRWGLNLQNRGAYFSLDPDSLNVWAPRKRTLHTLVPAMALRDGKPWLAFGTMGGDGQIQTHVQLLAHMVDERLDPQAAIDAPRWFVSPSDWSVAVEEDIGGAVIDGLRARGHRVDVVDPFNEVMGHAHAIEVVEGGYRAGTDPRTEGAIAAR